VTSPLELVYAHSQIPPSKRGDLFDARTIPKEGRVRKQAEPFVLPTGEGAVAELTAAQQANHRQRESNHLTSPNSLQTVVRALDLLFVGTGYLAGALYGVLAVFVSYEVLWSRKNGHPVKPSEHIFHMHGD
jgi:hypothetical protein